MSKFDFKFDADVYGLDKQCGRLAKVALDPATWQITNLIVENGILFMKRAKVIPVARIDGILAEAVYLAINSSELVDYPDYEDVVVEKAVPASESSSYASESLYAGVPQMQTIVEKVRTGLDDKLVLLGNHTAVDGLDNNIGRLSHVITAENFQIEELVVAHGLLLPKQIVIPIHLVESISEQHIEVAVANGEVDELPEFVAPDKEDAEINLNLDTDSIEDEPY